mmetsp:Transcript_48657/g.128635  ORF Transcript_48657/g.128635 Transcript_48657/m.128635 type:complete len:80 (+) Transcript_48657:128-367(+)
MKFSETEVRILHNDGFHLIHTCEVDKWTIQDGLQQSKNYNARAQRDMRMNELFRRPTGLKSACAVLEYIFSAFACSCRD